MCIAAASLLAVGCSKKFLDDPKPATAVSSTDVFASDAGVRAYFNGIYRNLRTQWGTSTDAWGIASVNLAREVKGLDASLPDQNWYSFDYLHDNREPTYRRVTFTWNFFYQLVNAANNMIDGVQKSSLSTTSKNQFLAEGRAFRAWSYFELIREFAHTYQENPNGPGVPIYTTPTSADTKGNPRSSIKDVYKLILDDLTFALANSATSRQLKDVMNKDVVNGLLARVYLETGDYPNAITAAQAARASYPLTPADYNTAFTADIATKKETIWGFPQASDQTIYYGCPSAFWGTSGTGYFNFFVDSNFVNTFKTTDIRRNFFNSVSTGVKKWKTNKFGNTTNFTDHLVMMRSAEMYLIEAEAKARSSQADAGTVLYTLQKNRDANAVASGNTGAALITEILLERRKEMFGEIGIGFLDTKRCQIPFQRSNGHITSAQLSFPANANQFTLKIPQAEFDANTSLKPTDQNP